MTRYSSMSAEELVWACTSSREADVWEEFVHRFHRVIATAVLRTSRHWETSTPQVLDDLVQETYLKLCADDCRLLREFEPQHADSIFGFLKTVTANVVHDHFKSVYAKKRGSGHVQEQLEAADIFIGQERPRAMPTMEREILLREIEGHLGKCISGPEQQRSRLIFWLYYRQGLSAGAIASLPSVGLSTKGVESAILRLTRMVRNRIFSTSESPPPACGEGFQAAESL